MIYKIYPKGTTENLHNAEIVARRAVATEDIISVWQGMQGTQWYAIQCNCMSVQEVPHIVLSNCMYVGELDYFYVDQPFLATYHF